MLFSYVEPKKLFLLTKGNQIIKLAEQHLKAVL